MLLVKKNSFDPWFNIAADEFVLRHLQEDVCMLWRNTPCVVVGKHQQALSEINRRFLLENNIPVIRRISGGGTVFHDLNCLNYSFITTSKSESDRINFELFTQPVREFLQSVGVDAQLTGKSNITVDGKKLVGSAQVRKKGVVLQHGSLPLEGDVARIFDFLKVPSEERREELKQELRARATSLELARGYNAPFEEVARHLAIGFAQALNLRLIFGRLSEHEVALAEQLRREKYATREWNFRNRA